MSSDNASSTVTYTSISSYSNGLSWGIPLVNADELPEMDPYEEVAQQGQAHPLSPAYVPDPMELDEHVPVEDQPYVDDASPTVESPGHIVDSESMKEDSIDYLDEPENDDEDPREDPEEDHTDDPADGEDGNDEPSNDYDDDDDTDDEDEEPTKDEEEEKHIASADSSAVPVVDHVPSAGDAKEFETDEYVPTPRSPQTRVPFSQTRLRRVWKTVILEPPMSASMEAHIAEHAAIPIPPTSPTYDQAPLGHRAAMIPESSAAAAKPPRGQYDFVDTVEAGQALQASEHRMMTSIKEVNLRVRYWAHVRRQESEDFYTQLHDARTDRRDIRLEIDVVRGQRTAYETELHERAEDDAVRHMMRTHVLEARAQIDTVEDIGSSC
ncbi:hypothetical protein Tco_0691640 [Tanacetum coccineum]